MMNFDHGQVLFFTYQKLVMLIDNIFHLWCLDKINTGIY